MKLSESTLGDGLLLFASGCVEKLATPTDCPTYCPGTAPAVFDTVLTASPGADSTYGGYLSLANVPSILVSNDIPGREARAFVRVPERPAVVSISGVDHPFTTDSLVFSFTLEGRDPSAKGITLYIHQIGRVLDTLTAFDDIESQLTAESLIDSLVLPDSAAAGDRIHVLVAGESLDRVVFAPEDSGFVAIGLRVAGDRPTGLRLVSHVFESATPTFITFAHVGVADTSLQKQSLTLRADLANYVIKGGEPDLPDDRHILGTRRAFRSLLRFAVPDDLRDSVSVLRATLELTPFVAIPGLVGDPGTLNVAGIIADFGARSPRLLSSTASVALTPASTEVVSVDVRSIVTLWLLRDGPPPALFMGVTPEGGTFALPEFVSTNSATGAPRIRLTYARPTKPGHP